MSRPTPATAVARTCIAIPEFLNLVAGTLRNQGRKMSDGDANAAAPGSTRSDSALSAIRGFWRFRQLLSGIAPDFVTTLGNIRDCIEDVIAPSMATP